MLKFDNQVSAVFGQVIIRLIGSKNRHNARLMIMQTNGRNDLMKHVRMTYSNAHNIMIIKDLLTYVEIINR